MFVFGGTLTKVTNLVVRYSLQAALLNFDVRAVGHTTNTDIITITQNCRLNK